MKAANMERIRPVLSTSTTLLKSVIDSGCTATDLLTSSPWKLPRSWVLRHIGSQTLAVGERRNCCHDVCCALYLDSIVDKILGSIDKVISISRHSSCFYRTNPAIGSLHRMMGSKRAGSEVVCMLLKADDWTQLFDRKSKWPPNAKVVTARCSRPCGIYGKRAREVL